LWFTNNAQPGSLERITPTGSVSSFTNTGFSRPTAITAGPDGALWFTNGLGRSIGRITTSGDVTLHSDPRLLGAVGITTGPDGAVWFTNGDSIGRVTTADSVVVSPDQGGAGTALNVTGTGFSAGETVAVKYMTGLSSPTSVQLCTAIAAGDGTFSCAGNVPVTAGGVGAHTIKAKGKTSGVTPKTIFLLTT
jgi:hypothetical protein